MKPEQLREEVLITYPVDPVRLDVFTLFLTPAGVTPRALKVLESTDLMLQMVAGNRGVAALPRWLVEEHRHKVAIRAGAAWPTRRTEADPPGDARRRRRHRLPVGVCRPGAQKTLRRASLLLRGWHNMNDRRGLMEANREAPAFGCPDVLVVI